MAAQGDEWWYGTICICLMYNIRDVPMRSTPNKAETRTELTGQAGRDMYPVDSRQRRVDATN